MNRRYCFWSVVDGDYALMAQAVVESARQVGVFKDFHIWTNEPIDGPICHESGKFEKWGWLFKLKFLQNAVKKLNYDYFVWLDMDAYFVRDPGDILRVLHGSPIHVTLESDLCSPQNRRPDWWGCPNEQFAALMRAKGVCSKSIFNVNGGFFIVHHDAIDTMFKLTFDFWDFCQKQGYTFSDEPLLSYAMHMLCGNPYLHTVRETADVWASDWNGCYRDALPDGQSWWFVDYLTEERIPVNPAIVHAMRSKQALIADAQNQARGISRGPAREPI